MSLPDIGAARGSPTVQDQMLNAPVSQTYVLLGRAVDGTRVKTSLIAASSLLTDKNNTSGMLFEHYNAFPEMFSCRI